MKTNMDHIGIQDWTKTSDGPQKFWTGNFEKFDSKFS